jgi:hypothetical protein
MKMDMNTQMERNMRRALIIGLFLIGVSASSGAEPTLHEVAVTAERPAGAPEYADVCFRYGYIRTGAFPTVEDARKAMRAFHANRVEWFYPGPHSADPGATFVTAQGKAFIADLAELSAVGHAANG